MGAAKLPREQTDDQQQPELNFLYLQHKGGEGSPSPCPRARLISIGILQLTAMAARMLSVAKRQATSKCLWS